MGEASLDELSTLGENTVAEFYHDRGFVTSILSPAHFPVQPAVLADLAGGDRQANAEIVRRLLRNEDHGSCQRDAVLLNAGAALFVASWSKSVSAGVGNWRLEIPASGKAAAKLEELVGGVIERVIKVKNKNDYL